MFFRGHKVAIGAAGERCFCMKLRTNSFTKTSEHQIYILVHSGFNAKIYCNVIHAC